MEEKRKVTRHQVHIQLRRGQKNGKRVRADSVVKG
jgi:hypothetical protein